MCTRRELFAAVLPSSVAFQAFAGTQDREPFPWTYKFNFEPKLEFNACVQKHGYRCLPGSKMSLYYAGNHFCTFELTVGITTVHGQHFAKLYKKLRDAWTIMDVQYLYYTNATFHQLVQCFTHEGIEQKCMKDWPFEDVIKFRSDPVGCIMYDIARQNG